MSEDKHQPVTEAELAEWKAKTDAATEGPWLIEEDDPVAEPWLIDESMDSIQIALAHRLTIGQGGEFDDSRCVADISWSNGLTEQDSRNAQFIAAAREAMPRLLAEVERLRAQVAWAEYEFAVCLNCELYDEHCKCEEV